MTNKKSSLPLPAMEVFTATDQRVYFFLHAKESFSITYKKSSLLLHTKESNTVHPNDS